MTAYDMLRSLVGSEMYIRDTLTTELWAPCTLFHAQGKTEKNITFFFNLASKSRRLPWRIGEAVQLLPAVELKFDSGVSNLIGLPYISILYRKSLVPLRGWH